MERHKVEDHGANPVIRLSGVSKSYVDDRGNAVDALTTTDLTVSAGEFVVLLGPSGCGKTTTLRIMAGLNRPSTGTVHIGEQDLWANNRRNPSAAREIAMVFQDANLFPWLSVRGNVELAMEMQGYSKRERVERAQELLSMVGLAGFEDKRPAQLSGGMKQRTSIARAFSCDPEILLMDEPFGALDAFTRDSLNLELQKFWLATGKTVVLVTHSISEAVFLADTIILQSPRPGRIVWTKKLDFERPRSAEIATHPEFQKTVLEIRDRLQQEESK